MRLTSATLRMGYFPPKLLIFGPLWNLLDGMTIFEIKIEDLLFAAHNSKHTFSMLGRIIDS